jgi:Domain of unknown function (DUF1707)
MNAAQDTCRPGQMRASDADRDAVVAALSENFQAGRLTTEELEDRTGLALAARTLGQLDELTADLPAPQPAPTGPAAPVTPLRRPRYPLMLPIIVPIAALAIVAMVLGASTGVHVWGALWVIPAAVMIARRLTGRREIRRDLRER